MIRFLIFLLCVFSLGCSKQPDKKTEISLPVPSFEKTDLSGEVFFIGPEIDSVKAEIVADCDCCASDLAFINDSSFIFIARCLEGDIFVKGTYLTFGEHLILRTSGKVVESEHIISVSDIEIPTTYEAHKDKIAYINYRISELKGKQFITYSKDDYTEYGIQTDESLRVFLKEFEDEKVLRDFLEK